MKDFRKGFVGLAIAIIVGLVLIGGGTYVYLNKGVTITKPENKSESNKSESSELKDVADTEVSTVIPAEDSTQKLTPSPSAEEWGCRSVTQGAFFDPNNQPQTVCGYLPTCPNGQSLITSLGEGTWPDGSRKGVFACSSTFPPKALQ